MVECLIICRFIENAWAHMTQTLITTLPETQILEQVLAEASNEDLTGLSPDDLVTLSKDLWVWASSCLDRNQHVQCRTVKTDQGKRHTDPAGN